MKMQFLSSIKIFSSKVIAISVNRQWRIQDFPEEGISPNFPKNCMKLKEFRPPLDPPLIDLIDTLNQIDQFERVLLFIELLLYHHIHYIEMK